MGRGELPADDVMRAVFPDYQKERGKQQKRVTGEGWFNLSGVANIMFRLPGRRRDKYAEATKEFAAAIPIRGEHGDMPVKIDERSGAVPGDRIVGILSPGEGVTVYPIQADALKEHEETAEEWLDVSWDIDSENPERFPGRVEVTSINAPGTLAEITDVIGKADANIANLFLEAPNSGLSKIVLGIEVWDLNHLNRVIRELRALSVVSMVGRIFK